VPNVKDPDSAKSRIPPIKGVIREMQKQGRPIESAIVCVGPASVEQEAIRGLLAQLRTEGEVESADTVAAIAARIDAGEAPAMLLVLDSAAAEATDGWIGALRLRLPRLQIAIYGSFDDLAVQTWLRHGVDALIERSTPANSVLETIAFVLAGNRYISPGLFLTGSRRDSPSSLLASGGWRSFLLEDLPVPMLIIQGERFVYANTTAKTILAVNDDEIGRIRFWDRIADSRRQEVRDLVLGWQRGEPVLSRMPVTFTGSSGKAIPTEWFSSITRIAGRVAVVAICTPTPGGEGRPGGDRSNSAAMQRPTLTLRQNDILALLANGASNKEIARRLELSEATVKLHVHRILRVLGGKNRTEAAHLARTLGLLDR
jgi:DNA-binding NarL/FixJ family response regulator